MPAPIQSQLQSLSIEQLESLGEALLDFEAIADLSAWLAAPNNRLDNNDS